MMDLIEKGSTVLVADDDRMFCVMLKQFFEANGYQVIIVEDGEQAVKAFADQSISLVMLDGDMPEMDGFAACEMIRSMPAGASVPVFIVTALEGEAALDCAMAVEASDFVTKPIVWSELRNKLSCMMDFDLA
ncbi:MAG: response regulator [Mariprofundus sp.]|nr:response regulator [Mariprofundus sp.]